MRGRKPVPTALKKLAGNPGRRKLNGREPNFAAAVPRAPRFLDEDAKIEWRRVVKRLAAAGMMTHLDVSVLAAYCQAHSVFKRARLEMEGEPLTLVTDKGYQYPNPLLGIMNTAESRMSKLATEFGMSPSSRSRVKAPAEPTEKSLAEQLFDAVNGE